MNRKLLAVPIVALAFGAADAVSAPLASAHNRGKIILPDGSCVQVGSLKSVTLPEQSGTPNSNMVGDELRLDLRPETTPQDEIGTAFVGAEGLGVIQLGDCP